MGRRPRKHPPWESQRAALAEVQREPRWLLLVEWFLALVRLRDLTHRVAMARRGGNVAEAQERAREAARVRAQIADLAIDRRKRRLGRTTVDKLMKRRLGRTTVTMLMPRDLPRLTPRLAALLAIAVGEEPPARTGEEWADRLGRWRKRLRREAPPVPGALVPVGEARLASDVLRRDLRSDVLLDLRSDVRCRDLRPGN